MTIAILSLAFVASLALGWVAGRNSLSLRPTKAEMERRKARTK
jgi:hypothetical protein